MDNCNLPFGSEFSPSQIDLRVLLEFAYQNNGNVIRLQQSILECYFSKHGHGNLDNQNKLAMNCRLGMKGYGIIDKDANLAEFGKQLYSLRHTNTLYDELAKYILLHLNGMSLIQCIRDMNSAGVNVSLETLPIYLRDRGITYPKGGKHPSIMRLWLAHAGIFKNKSWIINEDKLSELLKINNNEFQILEQFTKEQKAFLLTLANINPCHSIMSNDVVKLASLIYSVRFPEKSLPKLVLNDLVTYGYITIEKTTSGRGSKPFLVYPTNKLQEAIIAPLLQQIELKLDYKLFSLIRKPIEEIINDLTSTDRYISGLALEAFAFKLMKILDIQYIATRLKNQQTGGAEIDLIFESTRLIYSRWQIQCKNTQHVSLDDVAKEVGLTHFLKSNVIVIITTGYISREARKYSNKIMQDSNLCIVMIDKDDIEKIKYSVTYIVDIFNREAIHAMKIKKIDL